MQRESNEITQPYFPPVVSPEDRAEMMSAKTTSEFLSIVCSKGYGMSEADIDSVIASSIGGEELLSEDFRAIAQFSYDQCTASESSIADD
jgi:hypothetical protein